MKRNKWPDSKANNPTQEPTNTMDRWWARRASNLNPDPHIPGSVPHDYFDSPEDMWQGACEYFEWMSSRPQYEARPFQFKGMVFMQNIPKRRPFTLKGLLVFFDMSIYVWGGYKNRRGPGYAYIVEKIENVIYTQKFEGAAVDLFNANIIARDLGLRDSQEHTGPGGGPLQTQQIITQTTDLTKLTDTELDTIIKALDTRNSQGAKDATGK